MQLYFDGLVQDCCNSIANAMELLQSCTKPSICMFPEISSARQRFTLCCVFQEAVLPGWSQGCLTPLPQKCPACPPTSSLPSVWRQSPAWCPIWTPFWPRPPWTPPTTTTTPLAPGSTSWWTHRRPAMRAWSNRSQSCCRTRLNLSWRPPRRGSMYRHHRSVRMWGCPTLIPGQLGPAVGLALTDCHYHQAAPFWLPQPPVRAGHSHQP